MASQQPTPEIVLTQGLRARGVEVDNLPLESVRHIATSRSHDVVHVHHLSKAAVASSLSPIGPPLVFTAHSVAYPSSRRERLGLRVVTRRMAAGVCLSAEEARLRSAWFPDAGDRLHVIPNGLNLPGASVTRRAFDGAELRALFVGQLIDTKRVDLIIDALKSHPAVQVRLVYHNDALEEDLRTRAIRLGVQNRVTFVGRQSGDALFSEYRSAHALLLPSRHEALPSVITEALSTGLPVIASDVGGVGGQVQDAGVLIDPANPQSLVSGLERLAAGYSTYAAAAERRSAEVRRAFAVDVMVQRHIALYESLA